ncbi:MAG: non-ribosomal peptide synthetase, partial [bacterium]|nr:non-ribosomal peptide synthetase [bacterium]
MRIDIIRLCKEEYEFIWAFHHILMDGWCLGIMHGEFFRLYRGYLENKEPQLPKVKPYKHYIRWLHRQDKELSRNHWKQYLAHYREATGIPGLKRSPDKNEGYLADRVELVLEREDTGELQRFAGKNRVTLNILMQTLWGIMLGVYNRTQDVVFGAVVSGRPAAIADIESMVGLFINTIPVRIRWTPGIPLKQLLQQVQAEAISCEPHHYFPLAEIQAQSVLKQNLADHLLIFENYPVAQQLNHSLENPGTLQTDKKFELLNVESFEQTNYDFNVIIIPGEGLRVRFQYNANSCERGIVEAVAGHLFQLLRQVKQAESVSDLSLLTPKERQLLLTDFNDTVSPYPKDQLLHRWFERQV